MYPIQVSNGGHRPMGQAGYNARGQYVNAHGHSGWGVKADEKRPWGSYNSQQQMPDRPLQHSWGQPSPNVWDRFNSWFPTSQPSLTNPSSANLNVRFILLCSLWYASSALSSNTGKAILNQFRYPVTLTFIQFGFVSGCCLLLSHPIIGMVTIRQPSTAIIRTTLPMAAFQVGGHIFSSMAISRVPVSTVHTIKALSPLFTVAAYAILFGVKYSPATYISLLPLTIGVMLACTFDMSASNALGLICAFGSALIFVSSNIFFKKIMPSNSSTTGSHTKLDKINLLFYSSGLAFLLMVPIWLYYDLGIIWQQSSSVDVNRSSKPAAHSITYYFFVNGIVHWAQNILAFNILSSTSPVTYSIASLVKRIAVICIAIVWFAQSIHPIQGFGICLTFLGLWMYNAAKADVEKGESKMRQVEATRGGMLPVTKHDQMVLEGLASPEVERGQQVPYAHASGVTRPQFQPMPRGAPNPTFVAPARANPPPYPSPPASVDNSPPKESNPLPPPPRTPTKPRSTSVTSRGSRGSAVGSQSRPRSLFHRRSTLSGGGPNLLPPVIASIQIPPSTLPDVLVEEGPTPRTGALPPVTPRVGNASGLPATPIPATPRVGVAAR